SLKLSGPSTWYSAEVRASWGVGFDAADAQSGLLAIMAATRVTATSADLTRLDLGPPGVRRVMVGLLDHRLEIESIHANKCRRTEFGRARSPPSRTASPRGGRRCR